MATPVLTMTHYVFLTREQRYLINIPEVEIEVIGCCSPVWMENNIHLTEIAEEIFAKYKIIHCPEPERETINFTPEGFLVRLSPEMPHFLLNLEDNGHEMLSLTHKNVLKVEDKISPIVHFFHLNDVKVLEETLC